MQLDCRSNHEVKCEGCLLWVMLPMRQSLHLVGGLGSPQAALAVMFRHTAILIDTPEQYTQ